MCILDVFFPQVWKKTSYGIKIIAQNLKIYQCLKKQWDFYNKRTKPNLKCRFSNRSFYFDSIYTYYFIEFQEQIIHFQSK